MDPVARGPCLAALEARKATFDGVIVTNLFGMACDAVAYTAWAARNHKLCIFDNAATPMTFWNGVNLCALGDGAIISLHETKPLGRGEGGAVICSPDLVNCVHRAQNFGFVVGTPVRMSHPCASNWRMSDIAAAFIQARLQLLTPEVYTGADAILRAVNTLLDTERVKPWVRWMVPLHACVTRVFPSCLQLHTAVAVDAHAFHMSTGIEARQYYVPLADQSAAPVAWEWYTHCVCLPFDYNAINADRAVAAVTALVAWVAETAANKTIASD
jgi:dTDP-4-amino-4,6-dideoxygalactose transaminase